ncbi:MAG TPA: [FeFe] hydrogenase H-cluster radical SAM maturase HydE [Stenomitos sp.]
MTGVKALPRVRWQDAMARASAEAPLSEEDIVTLLESDPDEAQELFRVADRIRRKYMGDWVHLRGLIEFSNVCRRHCEYCGLRAGNRAIDRYRMSLEEILECVRMADRMGIRSVVLQSGEDPWYTVERLEELIRAVKATAQVAVTLSIGERSREDYRRLRRAGADRYLLKHETADEGLYRSLHPDSRFRDRLRCLLDLIAEDFQVGSGCMVGLPGQTTRMLAQDVILFRELELDMIGIGPFLPSPHTPLWNAAPGTVELTLKMVAVTRLVTKNAHMPATTALTTLDPLGREKAWQAGANVVMPLLTPIRYREQYQIYPDRACLRDDPEHCMGCLALRVASVGRWIFPGCGDSVKHPVHAHA